MLVDYGNIFTVSKNDIWAPVPSMKLLTQPPFGINCRLEVEPAKDAKEWVSTLMNRYLWVKVGPRSPDGLYYTVSVIDCFFNTFINNYLKGINI